MEGSVVDKDMLNKEADRILGSEMTKLSSQKQDIDTIEREIM